MAPNVSSLIPESVCHQSASVGLALTPLFVPQTRWKEANSDSCMTAHLQPLSARKTSSLQPDDDRAGTESDADYSHPHSELQD